MNELPRIRNLLANRSNFVRQQMPKIYYNYNVPASSQKLTSMFGGAMNYSQVQSLAYLEAVRGNGGYRAIWIFVFLFWSVNIFVSKKYIVKISIIASKHKIYPKGQITLTQTSSLLKVCSKSKILWFY